MSSYKQFISVGCLCLITPLLTNCSSAPESPLSTEASSADTAVAFETPETEAPVRKTTNTNQCIMDLGGLAACQNRGAFGLPTDLQGCCNGVRGLIGNRCECNPAIDTLLGPQGTQIYDLEALCRIIEPPAEWRHIPPAFLRPCHRLETHRYGCQETDMEIDNGRLKSVLGFRALFATAGDASVCLDTPKFANELSTVFAPDINFTVPYGIGTYTGITSVSEYLGMAFEGLTHGYWRNDVTPEPGKPQRLDVSPDGSTWTLGSTNQGDFLRGLLPYQDMYFEQDIKFEGCNTLVSHWTVHPTEGMRFVIERIVQTADLSKRWGAEDICRVHTQYCAGDPSTRQYASEAECLNYIKSLPLYTAACGPNRPLEGHSLPCKLKHHFMVPADPKLHCPHIGPMGMMDPNMHMKCDDTAECSTDEGQDAWLPVQNVGPNTPADIRATFDQSNVGFQSEPMGCAIPSTGAPQTM